MSPLASRIEERSLSERPLLSIIERGGDPQAALGFASLAAESPEVHAELGQLLSERLTRAGFQTQLVVHGLGFELTLLAPQDEAAGAAARALLHALAQPVAASEASARPAAVEAPPSTGSAVGRCSAELLARSRPSSAEALERERVATFARDRAAWSVVGAAASIAAVADALGDGPAWPALGAVRSSLPERSVTEVLRGERPTLSVALTLSDVDRALGVAQSLGEAQGALAARLEALGAGLRLRRVGATAHPHGACLRVDSELDASPPPDALRLGFAVDAIVTEAELALAETGAGARLEVSAVSASDPRKAARTAAYRALVGSAPDAPAQRLVALTVPDEGPKPASLDAAIERARLTPPLETQLRVESGQPGLWALLATPCATLTESKDSAGHAALALAAASAATARGVRLEPWVGESGVGLLGYAEPQHGETEEQLTARLADVLGRALVTPPSALDVASARSELLRGTGSEPRPLLEGLLEALVPGRLGSLLPRGSASSLQAGSLAAVLARQRELLRLPHRLAVLAPSSPDEAQRVSARLARWLKSSEPERPSPCASELSTPVRGELSLTRSAATAATPEGSYLAFRISPTLAAEAALLTELLNLPGGVLGRSLAEPELVGAGRASLFGTSAARALVIQISAFEGREAEALARVQKLFERLAAGGVLTSAELEAAAARQQSALGLAALDPRQRLVDLLEPARRAADAASLRRLTASLRPEAAIIARALPRAPAQSSGKSAPKR